MSAPIHAALTGLRRLDLPAGRSWQAKIRAAGRRSLTPRFAVATEPEHYFLSATFANATYAAVDLEIDGSVLRIAGTVEARYADGRSFGYVQRQPLAEAFDLPADACGEGAACRVEAGDTLLITIPRCRDHGPAPLPPQAPSEQVSSPTSA